MNKAAESALALVYMGNTAVFFPFLMAGKGQWVLVQDHITYPQKNSGEHFLLMTL